jgi:enoyl-CoA hydratase/carnithine racemase
MRDEPPVLFEKRDGIAWVTLNRPAVLNAIDLQMRDELWDVLQVIEADPDVGVVVFKGAGDRAFSSGADIKDFGTAPSFAEARRARRERDLWGRLAALDKPLIAAIQGFALGAGCELSLYCDFRIASEDARMGLPEVSLGYLPAAGGTQISTRLLGRGQALHLIATGEPLRAQEALEWGLVDRVVPRERLLEEAELLAKRLLAQPAAALRAARRAIRAGFDIPLEAGLRLEAAERLALPAGS